MQVTFDPKAPVNAGIDYSGIPADMAGKPSKGSDTGRWDEIILPPTAVADGAFKSARAVLVTSQGFATPVTLLGFVKVTTNGNYVCKVKRDPIPPEVKAVRDAQSAQQKADWKAGKRPQRPQQAAPVLPGQTTAPAAPSLAPGTPITAAHVAQMDALIRAGIDPNVAAQVVVAQQAAQQTTAPSVPSKAPKAPKAQ